MDPSRVGPKELFNMLFPGDILPACSSSQPSRITRLVTISHLAKTLALHHSSLTTSVLNLELLLIPPPPLPFVAKTFFPSLSPEPILSGFITALSFTQQLLTFP
ncbi:hypothetical protein PGTUg99_019650 [Puccinia graminis f. sp. tritici]|uniref:Uncharacterized protein n=1 Tax=Puccinia graminis f. sp. tritici TaxID=56615 RepID=A0A5B0R9B5_PUCGR|nr:hypothetical protein PGTUg99_019650 [Puccinia graminis f. sp. tritici]